MKPRQPNNWQLIGIDSFLLLHFLICSAVLVKGATILGWYIYSGLPIPTIAATFNEFFAEFSYWPKKPMELLSYVISIGLLAGYYAVASYVITRAEPRAEWLMARIAETRSGLIAYFTILSVANAALFFLLTAELSGFLVFMGFMLWLGILLLPIAGFVHGRIEILVNAVPTTFRKKVQILILVLITVQAATIFFPFIFGALDIPNDYLDIPEQTLVEGRYVNNTEYINAHRIGGLVKYNPERDQGKTPKPLPGSYIELKKTDLLLNFIRRHETYPILAAIQKRELPLEMTDFYLKSAKSRETRYHYDEDLGALVLHGKMSRQEEEELERIVGDEERPRVNDLFFKSTSYETFHAKRGYTKEELEFLRKNKSGFVAQAKAGWFFHHHSHMFAPMNEYALGKPLADLNAQYGKIAAVVLKELTEFIGGVNFQNYFKVLYSIFPLYLGLALVAAVVIFRNTAYVLLGAFLMYGSLLLISQELLFIAPGFNPIRHFFDIPAVIALYFYVTQRRHVFLILTLLCGVLGIVVSPEFGLILMLALLLVIGLRLFARDDRRPVAEMVSTALATIAAIAAALWFSGDSTMLVYYLLGVSAPSIEIRRLLVVLAGFSLLYVFTVKTWRTAGPTKYLFLFLFLYTQGSMIYFVWNPGIHHLLALAPIWALMVLVMLKIISANPEFDRYRKVVMLVIAAFVTGLLYLPALGGYYLSRADTRASFNSHMIYAWEFPAATFRSTMDPSYFSNAVALINKYAPENGIFIISKYDNLVPYIAQKYSAMPFIEVATSLVSRKEIDLCIQTILTARPPYLFVDTDIERNLNGDIFHELDPVTRLWGLYAESFSRVKVLNLQKQVYEGVKHEYERVESGVLVSVYKRKAGG